jgi:hypothetical protein
MEVVKTKNYKNYEPTYQFTSKNFKKVSSFGMKAHFGPKL